MICCSRTSILRLGGWCCLLELLVLMGGCKNARHAVEHAEVSGRVLVEGQPLPGGQVTFVTVKDGFASSGPIDESGNYKVQAPIGDVVIGVDNRMLMRRRGPQTVEHPKQPGAEEKQNVKGQWVAIPVEYSDPAASGLKYTVKPGPQTYDIQLSAKLNPPPGAPGP
jgi:hypothetical protein